MCVCVCVYIFYFDGIGIFIFLFAFSFVNGIIRKRETSFRPQREKEIIQKIKFYNHVISMIDAETKYITSLSLFSRGK